jgi:hypothetical protein
MSNNLGVVKMFHNANSGELQAAKKAIRDIVSAEHRYETNLVIVHGIFDLISTHKDPKVFVNDLCVFMKQNKMNKVFINFDFFELNENDVKLEDLINIRQKNGRLQNYSLEKFHSTIETALKDEDEFRHDEAMFLS